LTSNKKSNSSSSSSSSSTGAVRAKSPCSGHVYVFPSYVWWDFFLRPDNNSAMALNDYLRTLLGTLQRQKGLELTRLSSLPLAQAQPSESMMALVNDVKRVGNLQQYCMQHLSQDHGMSVVITCRLSALVSLAVQDYEAVYKHELATYNATLDYFSNMDETIAPILIPVLVRVSNDLRVASGMADEAKKDIGCTYLRESLNSLMKGFTVVAKDRTPVTTPTSKKLALFAVVNVLFKMYFKLNTLQLCSKLIELVEKKDRDGGSIMDNLHYFPVCDVVTYKYYFGRLKMFEDRYEEARECLRFAFRHCPRSELRNRQRILISLVPIEMCLGTFPSEHMARIYKLDVLVHLGNAAKQGDLRTFNSLFEEHQRTFIRLGVYLVLEQVKIIAYRNLFKRVHGIMKKRLDANASNKLSIEDLEAIIQWLGETSVDMDEIECILSNLIHQSKVKGYLSHQKRTLVISKADPFPTAQVVKKSRLGGF